MLYRLPKEIDKALSEVNRLCLKNAIIEIAEFKQTRTNQQNKALHLFFRWVSDELNDIGIPFVYMGLKGIEIESEWTELLFKEMTWKPIQKALYGINSTTKLKRDQIDKIFNIICKWFAEKGVEISFPNNFDFYLNQFDNNNKP